MDTNYKVAVALIAGIAIGGVGTHGLHAQAKPKGYVITESEIIDQEAWKEYAPKAAEANKALGGQYLVRGGKIAALEGEPPKRVTISVYDSFEQAQASRIGSPEGICIAACEGDKDPVLYSRGLTELAKKT